MFFHIINHENVPIISCQQRLGEAYGLETGLAVFVFIVHMTIDLLIVLILGASVMVVVSKADLEADSFSPKDMLAQEDGVPWDNLHALDKQDTTGTEATANTPALIVLKLSTPPDYGAAD